MYVQQMSSKLPMALSLNCFDVNLIQAFRTSFCIRHFVSILDVSHKALRTQNEIDELSVANNQRIEDFFKYC